MRVAVATLIAGLLLPAPLRAQAPAPADPQPTSTPAAELDAGSPGPGLANQLAGGFAIGFDLVVLRPLGVVATVVGAALFVPVAAISAAGGREALEEAYDLFIAVPAKSVYQRPLGDF